MSPPTKRVLDFEWTIRKGRPSDAPLLVNSWLKSFNEQLRSFDRRSGYWQAHKALIANLLEQPSARVYVACREDDDDKIVGYVVGEVGHDCIIHFVYVKKAFRRAGVGDGLISRLRSDGPGMAKVVCTHEGEMWTGQKRRSRAWSYAPRGIFYRMILELARSQLQARAEIR